MRTYRRVVGVSSVVPHLLHLFTQLVVGGIVLAYNERALPGELIAIGSAAAGAIGGILSRADSGAVPVTVVNPDESPVPVEPQSGYTTLDILLVAVVAAVLLFVFLTLAGVINVTAN